MSKLFNWAAARIVAAFALALPLAALAVTTKDYEDFGDTAGVVLWRGTEANFHASTVIDVAEDGSLGQPYAMTADQTATSWQRFASNQSAYASPGKVLVYDSAGTGDGYKYNPDCTFGPLSFGGMWVKTLAINSQPFSILGTGDRKTEFGARGKSTLFKFDASYTINRQGTTTFYGDATVDIAQGATFTAQAYSGQAVAVDSAATLKLKGAGTLAVTTMNVAGTLDLSAATVPSISGNVAFAGNATLVVPASTTLNGTISLGVCSGTLSAAGVVYVKVGNAEPVESELTISGGTITQITTGIQTEQTFTSDYPSVVPAGYTYTYEATEAVTIPAVTVNGTLKTSGPITITDLDIANGADFEVVAGNTTVNCSADCKLKGNIKVDAGATLTNKRTDSLSYNHSMTVDVYGTLAMGTTRWSIPGGCTFNLRNGAQVTGTGDSLASLDFISGASRGIDVYGSATVEGKVRVRANETRIWVNEGSTLVLSSGIADGSGHHAGFKQVGLGTLEIHANSTGLSGNASIMTQGTLRLVDTTLAFPVALQGNNSYLEVVATEATTTVPVNVTSIANNNVTLSGAGKVNGSITKTSAPSGDLATALQSSAWTGTFVADWAGASNAQFDINAYGNANSVVEVAKLAGGYVSGSNANVTVVPTVKVSGTMKLDNGYSGKTTTFTKLTGTGTFTQGGIYPIDITVLDGFTGTIVGEATGGTSIGTINLSETPSAGGKLFSISPSSAILYNFASTKVSVNGVVDDTIKIEAKSDGIYVKAHVTITITPVTGATATVTVNGEPREIEDGHITVTVGDTVVVTYTGDEDHKITGSPVEFEASTTTTSVDTTSVKSEEYKAQIMSGTAAGKYTSVAEALSVVYMTYANPAGVVVKVLDSDYEDDGTYSEFYIWDESEMTYTFRTFVARVGMKNYDSLAEAMSAVTAGGTVVCLVDTITLDDVLVITNDVTLGGVASGTTITGADLNKFIRLDEGAALTLVSTVSVNCQIRFNDAGATVTLPEEDYTEPSMRPITGYSFASTSNGDGTKTYSLVKTLYLYAAGVNVTLAYSPSGETMGAIAVVNEGDVINFTATPAEGYENPVVTANNVTLTPEAGVYSVTIGDTNMTIQATATEMPKVAEIAGGGQYASLSAAFASAQDGDTITVLADNTLSATINVTNSVALDLNGHTVTGAEGDKLMFELKAAIGFTIEDTSEGGTGKVYSAASKVVLANGQDCNFTLESGTLESGNSVPVYIYGDSSHTYSVTISGGTLKSSRVSNPYDSSSAADYCIVATEGTITFTGDSTIYSTVGAFRAKTVNVSGGSVTVGDGRTVCYSTSGVNFTYNFTGGTFNRDVSHFVDTAEYEVVNNGNGTYTVREDKGWVYAAPGYWNHTGTWSEGATIGADKVTIESNATYTAGNPSAGQLVTVEMTLSFDDTNDDVDGLEDAKSAVRLAAGETDGTYQFQLYTSDGANRVWTNATVDVTAMKEVDYTFVFVLDLTNKTYTASIVSGTTTNAMTVGGATNILFAYQGADTPVQRIDFVGSCAVTSIKGSYETPKFVPGATEFVLSDVTTNITLTAKQADWLNACGSMSEVKTALARIGLDAFDRAYLLNLNILDENYEDVEKPLSVTAFDVGDASVTVEVTLMRKGKLDGGINGTLKLTGAVDLGSDFDDILETPVGDDDFSEGDTATWEFNKGSEKFFLPVIE